MSIGSSALSHTQELARRRRMGEAREHDGVWPATEERTDLRLLRAGLIAAVRHDQVEPGGREDIGDSLYGLCEERMAQGRHDGTDDAAHPRREASRRAVRDVADAQRRSMHPLARFGPHLVGLAERPRHRHLGDAGERRDVGHARGEAMAGLAGPVGPIVVHQLRLKTSSVKLPQARQRATIDSNHDTGNFAGKQGEDKIA
jgi:hypothetical protein